MRCTEARRKLSELAEAGSQERRALDLPGSTGSEFAIDKELAEHLRLCPACAREAEAIRMIRKDFAAAAVDDQTDTIPFAALKTRVETQASLKHRSRLTENTIMTEIVDQFRKRPRLSFGVVVMALIIAGSVLIPIRYNKTIGYEVAVAGVDKDIALDQQKVRVFLEQLGVSDPKIDVTGCDTTCVVTIRDLKSAEEAQIVVAAFGEVPNVHITKGVTEISESEKGNLIEFTADKITMARVKLKPMGEIKKLVIERLGEEPLIVLSGDSTGAAVAAWSVNCDSGSIAYTLQGGFDSASQQLELYSVRGTAVINLSKDGSLEGYTITHEDGTVDTLIRLAGDSAFDRDGSVRLYLPAGTPIKGFASDGITVDTFLWLEGDTAHQSTEDEAPDSVDKEAAVELPEGYELGQNYPNPFNPTTKIDYSVPSAQRVKIDVLNVKGQVVRTLVDEVVSAGTHTVEWDAKTDDGSHVATGAYIYRLVAGDVTQTRKMTYVK